MNVFPLRRIISKFLSKLQQTYSFKDVLAAYDMGNLCEAYTALCSVVKNEPYWLKDGDVYTLWAELELLTNHNPSKALELLDKANEIGCSEMGYYYKIRAEALWDASEGEIALQYFEKSVAEDSSVPNLTSVAQVLSFIRDKRAMDVWQRILDNDPKNCQAHIYIGWEAAKSGDRNKALLMANKAEELQTSLEELVDIGRLYHELGEFQSAIKKYLEANKLDYYEEALLYAAIADCYLSLGDEIAARKYAEWAMRCDPENAYVKDVWHEYKEKSADK